jgi:hypothetical protein
MKIEEIHFPLNLGTADELNIIVSEGFAYYNLVDTNQTTSMPNGPEVPYRVLYSNRLQLEEGQTDVDAINSMIIELLGVEVIPEQE